MVTDTNTDNHTDNVQQRGRLSLPLQAAPVDRVVVASGLTGDGSVNPSFNWQSLIPIATSLLGAL